MAFPPSEEQKAQNERLKKRMSGIKHKVLVMSGKGGVGKSSVSANLALEMASRGVKVGILDTDLHGPNIPKMLGVDDAKLIAYDEGIEPFAVTKNLVAVSLAMAGHDVDAPIIWRGPVKIGVIRQFLADVEWGDLDLLVIDTPPGTGDEPLTVAQMIPELDGAIVVTTPQEVAILDSRKSVNFAKQLNLPLIGIVENMSGFICPNCGTEHQLFGSGGGERAAKEMGVPFLGKIPIDPLLMNAEDSGRSYLSLPDTGPAAAALRSLVDKTAAFIGL
ncbi:Mrp/NBP35 family ATP-binding protein [Sediminispirochaeta smaragdinae]|jgi:Mrp family chromosome partitioning ATPase|uniref:Iron-sulfur cluster carrier protein n=1 Tax=Sediminispirochaeta smaragdinae (strain DSM 11293 / JCM 15392 / SEBR 4228) TaxID=573413 RepID=E1RAB9_SEDSS|nr:Mrp/NBP35 family ATP-binding protein [Sediminispirochaeta smaragdinae]ADK79410.1 ATPase-like, ParA/MinD [Sediminispirochaeta smaragdinae DSM 11293]